MRHLLTFTCEGSALAASLDEDGGGGATGLLMATGGTQTRIGSHRMYERLGQDLAAAGFPCFRFDRRGVGDSEGHDPGFRGSGADIAAAAAAFRREAPVRRVIGFGLCDAGTALALHGAEAALDGLILVNPWLVEAEAGEPPPAAVRRHYRDRLLSAEGWRRLFRGGVDWRRLVAGLKRSAAAGTSPLAAETARALRARPLPCALILAERDATAVAAAAEMKDSSFKGLIKVVQTVPSDSHTFARPGDAEALAIATLGALRRLAG